MDLLIQGGREISAILLRVVGVGEMFFLFSFVHLIQLISLEIMRKIDISRFISQGRNINLKKYVFDVVYVKSNSITC